MRYRIKPWNIFSFPGFFYRIPGVGSVRDVIKVCLFHKQMKINAINHNMNILLNRHPEVSKAIFLDLSRFHCQD